MSGYVCGAVSFNKGAEKSAMDFNKDVIDSYKIDKFQFKQIGNARFGCGLITITEESLNEELPAVDQISKLFITADAILDNRGALISRLELEERDLPISDSEIILEAYKRWGYQTPKYILGDFAFAIWDESKSELFITRDHTGTRSLYYSFEAGVFRFSTTLAPLLVDGNPHDINDKWLGTYFAMPYGIVEYDCHETLYKGIYQLPYSESFVVRTSGIEHLKFWDPINEKVEFPCNSKEDYLAYFREIYDDAVGCRLRTIGDVGIFLSGGLDSSSVAAVAAMNLEKSGKNLRSYTSVPNFKLESTKTSHFITNEKPYVESLLEMYPNITANYLTCKDKNIFDEAKDIMKIIEMPFKVIENMLWIKEGYASASSDGCKIMLKGQFGNVTVSRGEFPEYINTLLYHKRYLKVQKEIKGIAKLYGMKKRTIYSNIVSTKFSKNHPEKSAPYNSALGWLSPAVIAEHDITRRLEAKELIRPVKKAATFYDGNKLMLQELSLSVLGVYDTKMGLHHGIITRDPTKDIRIISFCMHAPYELFTSDGVDRKLIREAMAGLLPDEIRLNHLKRGLQGADWKKRLESKEPELEKSLKAVLGSPKMMTLLNKESLEAALEQPLFKGDKSSDFFLKQSLIAVFVNWFMEDNFSQLR